MNQPYAKCPRCGEAQVPVILPNGGQTYRCTRCTTKEEQDALAPPDDHQLSAETQK